VRRVILGLMVAVLTVTACQDAQGPGTSFQVADGSAFGGDGMTGGNPNFFFLPPLVPSPTFSGTFDATLLSYLRVQVSGPYDNDGVAACKALPDFDFGEADGLSVDPVAESYAYGWNTPKSLRRDKVYRLCVALATPGTTIILGYRDVSPTQGGGSVAEDPVYRFNLGSNLAVKFRVEEGVLNAECPDTGQDYDCTLTLLTKAGDEGNCVGNSCAITAGGLSQPTLFLVERLPCSANDDPAGIPEGDGPDMQGVNWIKGLDIPQYAGCVRVTVYDENWNGFSTPGVVGACFYDDSGPPLADKQDESLRLHLQEQGKQPVSALDRVPSTSELSAQCQTQYTLGAPPPDAPFSSRLAWHIRQGWRHVQRTVDPWFAPPEALAFHTGFGGSTDLKSGDGSTPTLSVAATPTQGPTVQFQVTATGAKVYMLAWALPSQMEKYQLGSTDGVVAAEPLATNVGTPVTVKVKVTDDGETDDIDQSSCVPDPLGGQICGYLFVPPREVKKALVHFAATNDATLTADSVLTTFDGEPYGIAEVTVTPTKSGTSLVTASGYGIGARPATGFGGFVPPANGQITLQSGSLSFEIYACDNTAAGFITPTIDGGLDAAWQGAQFKATIPVNLGGNTSSTADLYVGHDCNYIYLALAVGADESNNNSLRVVFDNNADGSEGLGDNVISLTKNASGWLYQDRFLSADCIGSKQANCGPDDTSAGGSLNGNGAAGYDGAITKFVYEFRFPLKSGDSAHDFQRVLGQSLGYYLALSLGNGTKGNTEWPDQKGNFKSYQNYVLTQY